MNTYEHSKIQRSNTVPRQVRRSRKPMELCLCSQCASYFGNSPDYYLLRQDPCQVVKETCTFCNTRTGYDYWVISTAPYKRKEVRRA